MPCTHKLGNYRPRGDIVGIQYDDRAKKNKYVGYYWDKLLKRKITVGCFETREDAQDAVRRALILVNEGRDETTRATEVSSKNERFQEMKTRDLANLPSRKEEKKGPVDLKFGRWK